MPERTQRYSEAERQSQAANRRRAAGGAKYGTSYAEQGYRPVKEGGLAFLNRQKQKVRGGPFDPLSWQQQGYGSNLMLKAMPNQTGRIAEGGGEWRPASQVLSPGHWAAYLRTTEGEKGQKRKAFFDANPQLANTPGGGMDAWTHQRYLNALPTDPVTGQKINRFGDTYDASNRILAASGAPGGALGVTGGPGGIGGRPTGKSGPIIGPGGPGQAGQGIEASLQQGLQGLLSGEGPFTPEVVQNLRNQAKTDAYGGLKQELRGIDDDAIARGIYRSGTPADQGRMAREAAAERYSTATQNIGTTAAIQNYQGRLSALDRAQKWLDSKRQWILANETNALNRELGLKQIGLGYARIQAEQASLEKSLSYQREALGQQAYQFDQLNPNMTFTDPVTGKPVVLKPGDLRYLDYFTG